MKTKQWLAGTCVTILALGSVVGCASGSGTKEAGKPAAGSNEPTTIKALAVLSAGEPPVLENSQALKEIEKKANVKLNLEFVPGDVYPDKVNIAIASGSQYDLILLTDGKDEKYTKLVKQGAFHNLTALAKDMPNLQKIPQYTWDNTTVKNEIFGIPRPRSTHGGGNANFFLRKDWLDKYNLPVPKTVDELTNVLKVFKEKDPAGGGKTVPMIAGPFTTPWFGSVNPVAFAFGLPYSYKIEGDKPVAYFQTPEYKAYLDWLRMAYTSGLIDKDAPVLKTGQVKDKFKSGVAGMMVDNVSMMNENNLAVMRKTDPKAELVGVPYLEGPGGKKGVQMIEGYYGIWVVPTSVAKDKVKKIVEFLNWTASDEGTELAKAGIPGVHYTKYDKESGAVERNEEQKKLYDKEKPMLLVLQNAYDKYIYADSQVPEIKKAQKEVLDGFDQVGVPNPFIAFVSETASKNPDHQKKLSAAAVNYVMGTGNWEAVQAEIEAWSKGLGAQIMKEYMDQYNESKKK